MTHKEMAMRWIRNGLLVLCLLPAAAGAQMISGGIGLDAREALEAEAKAKAHNLKLVFAQTSGEYLADVHIRVVDAAGKQVVDHVARGPWAYARLPPGSYAVTATLEGAAVERKVTVPQQGQRVEYFRWQVPQP